jgi:alkylation response protein AidB-like acyl-CoA dehydrogenase
MFDVSDEQNKTRSWAREFAEREVAPCAAEMDRTGEYDGAVLKALFSSGMMGMLIPEEYGGTGATQLEYVTAVEELARCDASTALVMSIHGSLCAALLSEFGPDDMKARFLPELASKKVGAFALTELDPGAPTQARDDGDAFVVEGTKMYITNGPVADIIVLFAVTGEIEIEKGGKVTKRDETSALLVEPGQTRNLTRENLKGRLGLCAAPVGKLEFGGVSVPRTAVVGKRGGGFKMAMKALDGGRIGAAAMSVGIGQAALENAKAYALSRVTQGRPIAKLQAVQFMIAEMATRLEAARALTYRAASAMDGGGPYAELAAQAKLFASETASFAASKALQVHGGSGVVRSLHPVERLFRDARVMEIIEGTSEIQKLVVAGWELKG